MKSLWDKYKSLFLYLVFGGITTVANILTYILCYNIFRMPNVVSNVIAWILAIAVAYITNKLWVFETKSYSVSQILAEVGKFVGCRLATGILDLIIMYVGVDCLHGPSTILKISSNVIVIILNYILSRFVIFSVKQ